MELTRSARGSYETKMCPRCGAELYADMSVCYGCLYDFTRDVGHAPGALPSPVGAAPSSDALGGDTDDDGHILLRRVGGVYRERCFASRKQGAGGVLHFDDVAKLLRGDLSPHGQGFAQQPYEQIDGVDRLIHQHSAALRRPLPAPISRRVVGGVPVPIQSAFGALRPSSLKISLSKHGGGVVSVLETHPQHRGGLLFGGEYARDVLAFYAQGLFAKHVHPPFQRLDRHIGVQIMRRADVYGVDVRREGGRDVRVKMGDVPLLGERAGAGERLVEVA